jgi:hypothetical protein
MDVIRRRVVKTLLLIATSACVAAGLPAQQQGAASRAIDAGLWTAVSRAVADGDIAALARTYHANAVLVDARGTSPIAGALDGWGKGMAADRKSGRTAAVAFRFSSRQDDSTTAFERGIFKYTTTDKGKPATSVYVEFEALIVRSSGRWQTLMERQIGPVTIEAWNRLPQ